MKSVRCSHQTIQSTIGGKGFAARVNDRATAIENIRAIAAVGVANITNDAASPCEAIVSASATCGSSGVTAQPDAFVAESLEISEINTDGVMVARVVFDPDDIDAAFEELDARYLAGEAAAHAHTWSVVARGYAAHSTGTSSPRRRRTG